MLKKKSFNPAIILAFWLLTSVSAFAQKTHVSGTIVDPTGVPYDGRSGGIVSLTLIVPGGGTGATYNGAAIGGLQFPVGLDNNGRFATDLWDNNLIRPTGTKWRFEVSDSPGCAPPWGNGPVSFSVDLTITGGSQSVSSALQAAAPQLCRNAVGPVLGDVNWFKNNVAVGTEPGGDFVEGTNITITATDDPGASRVHYTINAAGGGAVCTNIAQVTDLYVSTTGSNTTGDGTIGNPWLTIQHAIDVGVPGIVCGRYIIHLASGNYPGQVILQGRIFAGGGTALNGAGPDNPDDSFWPIAGDPGDQTDNTWPYSWVEIVGSSAEPGAYTIQAHTGTTHSNLNAISLSHAYLTLRGVQVQLSAYGVNASQRSLLNLAGDVFLNNSVGVMATEQSTVHIDPSATVNDAGFDTVLFTNTTIAAVPYTGVDGIELADASFLSDYDSTGNNTNTGAVIHYQKGAGTVSIGCIEMKYASIYFRGDIKCEVSGIVARSSNLAVLRYDFDGLAPNTGTALDFQDSQLTGQVFGGANFNISNAATAVREIGSSFISPFPNIISATTSFVGAGGDSIPANVQSRNTFLVSGSLTDTVTFSATPTFDMNNNGSIKKITLTGDVTSSSITNQRPGDEITFQICQDGGGAHAFAFPANVNGAGTISGTASKCNVQRFFYDQAASKWYALAAMVTAE